MRYEITLDGKKVSEGSGVMNLKKLQDYLKETNTLVDDIDYRREEVVVYKLKKVEGK